MVLGHLLTNSSRIMSEPQLPTICDLKFDFNEPTERKAAFAWLRIVALVLTNVARQQLRQYLKALRRDERGECVIVLRGTKFGSRSCPATSFRSRAGAAGCSVPL